MSKIEKEAQNKADKIIKSFPFELSEKEKGMFYKRVLSVLKKRRK